MYTFTFKIYSVHCMYLKLLLNKLSVCLCLFLAISLSAFLSLFGVSEGYAGGNHHMTSHCAADVMLCGLISHCYTTGSWFFGGGGCTMSLCPTPSSVWFSRLILFSSSPVISQTVSSAPNYPKQPIYHHLFPCHINTYLRSCCLQDGSAISSW